MIVVRVGLAWDSLLGEHNELVFIPTTLADRQDESQASIGRDFSDAMQHDGTMIDVAMAYATWPVHHRRVWASAARQSLVFMEHELSTNQCATEQHMSQISVIL
jgi:hypothetical protein